MLSRGSVLPCQNNLLIPRGECPAGDKDNSSVRQKGGKSIALKDESSSHPKRSTLSRLSKFISGSLKMKKKGKHVSKSDLVQSNIAKETGFENYIVTHIGSSSNVDMNINASLHNRGDFSDDDEVVLSSSKYRRMSLPAGCVSELNDENIEDSRQHSFMWNATTHLSHNDENSQSSSHRKSFSRGRFNSSRNFGRFMPTFCPAVNKPTIFSTHTSRSRGYDWLGTARMLRDDCSKWLFFVQSFVQNVFKISDFDRSSDLELSMLRVRVSYVSPTPLSRPGRSERRLVGIPCRAESWHVPFGMLASACRDSFTHKKTVASSNLSLKGQFDPSNHNDKHKVESHKGVREEIASTQNSYKKLLNSTKPVDEDRMTADPELTSADDKQKVSSNSHNQENSTKSRRVASWAINFDQLLQDSLGINIFTKLLEKEFSDENIKFWQVCEQFRGLNSEQQQKAMAKDIYTRHLAVRASEPVNVDNAARSHTEQFFDIPTATMFDAAQNQILRLMKLDSYPRFLKSDLYKSMLAEELLGKIHHEPERAPENTIDNKKNHGKEIKEKRKRSVLPWKRYF